MWLATTLTFDPGVGTGRWQTLFMGDSEVQRDHISTSQWTQGGCTRSPWGLPRVEGSFIGLSVGKGRLGNALSGGS